MLKNVTPESVGISSKDVLGFLKRFDAYEYSLHSIIMARGDKIFAECYYKPFDKNFKHRMYSTSKSFVGIAIGFLEQDGLISLDDKFIKYFPEYKDKASENMLEMTIRDMLTMSTCIDEDIFWFTSGTADRNEVYFRMNSCRIPGTTFKYDSPGSYMLGVIVEKQTGMTLIDYLIEKALKHTEFSKDAYCLKCPGGYSFSDSGVMCTARDLLIVARLLMDKGNIDGINYLNPEYIEQATKKQVDNDELESGHHYNRHGYGYQIWKTPNDGFAFIGAWGQLAICDPKSDFVIITTGQSATSAREILFHELYNFIIPKLGETMDENPEDYKELEEYLSSRTFRALKGKCHSKTRDKINNVTYILDKNPMEIEYIRFNFEDNKGTLTYKNRQGEKKLYFKMCENEFFKFPQENYSDMVATIPQPGHMYDCACSAAWCEENKLKIFVQIIDKYFGELCMTFSFKDDRIAIRMAKSAEAFLNEYQGFACGKAIK